jgi:hypothetical protein
MTKSIARTIVVLLAVLASAYSGISAASAAGTDPVVVAETGNRTFYSDGTVAVEVPAGTMSLTECESGQFCVWSQANYIGSFRYKTGTGSKTLGGTVGSFWNNRTTIARLYNNTSSTSTCYENGVKKASVSASYAAAEKVTLGSSASC